MWPEHASCLALLCPVLPADYARLARATRRATLARRPPTDGSAAAAGWFRATGLSRRPALLSAALHFFFTAPAPTAVYTLSLHDALPVSWPSALSAPAPRLRFPNRSTA